MDSQKRSFQTVQVVHLRRAFFSTAIFATEERMVLPKHNTSLRFSGSLR
jgi:hypothetical protein